jgi:hypothetical protein
VDIPLDKHGRFTDMYRRQMLSTRKIEQYRPVYLEPWVEDLTTFYKLPKTGVLDVHCFVPAADRIDLTELEKQIEESGNQNPSLWVLPETAEGDLKLVDLTDIAERRQVAFALAIENPNRRTDYVLITPEGKQDFYDRGAARKNEFPFKILKFGPAGVAMASYEDFKHPELGVVLSKLGADLVVLSEDRLSPQTMLMSRIKTLAGIAVAACSENAAEITCVKDIHGTQEREHLFEPGVCSYTLDTAKTRKKRFQSRIDFDLLLRNQP